MPCGGLLPSASPVPGMRGRAHRVLSCPRAPRTPRATQAACHATWRPRCRTSRPSASWPCSRRVSSTPPQLLGVHLPSQPPRAAGLWLCSSLFAHLGQCLAEEGMRLCPFPAWPRAAGLPRAVGALWTARLGAAARLQRDTGASLTVSCFSPLSPPPSTPPLDGAPPADPLSAEPLQPGDVPGRNGLPRVAPRQQHGCSLVPFAWMGRGHDQPGPRGACQCLVTDKPPAPVGAPRERSWEKLAAPCTCIRLERVGAWALPPCPPERCAVVGLSSTWCCAEMFVSVSEGARAGVPQGLPP